MPEVAEVRRRFSTVPSVSSQWTLRAARPPSLPVHHYHAVPPPSCLSTTMQSHQPAVFTSSASRRSDNICFARGPRATTELSDAVELNDEDPFGHVGEPYFEDEDPPLPIPVDRSSPILAARNLVHTKMTCSCPYYSANIR